MSDPFRPIDAAPRDCTIIRAEIPGYGDNHHIAWEPGFLTSDLLPCRCWVHHGPGDPPPCWTDGVCWESNADDQASVRPTRWTSIPKSSGEPA